MMHAIRWRAIVGLATFLGAATPAWTQEPVKAPPSSPTSPAPAFAVQPQPTKPAGADDRMIKGITRCVADLNLSFAITGRLAEVSVAEGDEVKTGQNLAALDQVAESLDVERRRLQWENKAEYQAALARASTAQIQAKAARQIYETNRGVSAEEVQNRELALALAQAEAQRIKVSKEMERLDYLTARENLDRRNLRAPTPGIIVKLVKQAGESVQANEPAIKLCDMSKVLFYANVPSAMLEGLDANDQVDLLIGSDGRAVPGKVLFVSPVLDPASGLREVKIEISGDGKDPARRVRPGMTARLDLARVKKIP